MNQRSIFSALREMFSHISLSRRHQLVPVLALMLAGALAELVSIGAILPFLALIADPQTAMTEGLVRSVLEGVGLITSTEIVAAAALVFAFSAVLAGAVRLVLVWVSQRYVFGIAKELSVAIYGRTLHQPYAYHTSLNSSQTLAAINKAQLVTGQLLVPMMQAASASVIALFILIGLVLINPLVALSSGFGFAAIYILVIVSTRAVMRRNGGIIAEAQGERVQAAGEGLGGIRDVLLDRSQSVFVARFDQVEGRLCRAQATSNFVGQTPRFIVEGLGVVLIAGLALALSLREGGLAAAIPLLGALALGAQRLVPLLQLIYSGWASALSNGKMLYDILDILRLPEAAQFANSRDSERLPFTHEIVLDNVGFCYPTAEQPTLKNVGLTISKGARVGIVGKTGSGKSTLMDLVLGLLVPSSGRILIDGVALSDSNRSAWQAQVAHVPQTIYLTDATIAENIAFGVPPQAIDYARVVSSAQQAELVDVIGSLPRGYNTLVGERGIRLSGGQRQRIGIARALYKQATVLVFDEATSALDGETEAAVMKSIGVLRKSFTIIMISHRLSTIKNCDVVVEVGPTGSVSRRLK